ncbi:MAG: sulfatase-like hydrolase/transferase [Sutterella sp.]|nr:sulfatase-like hydrolase/transferase [Sutterella sp.]
MRGLAIPLIALHTLQLTNLLMTGNFVVATTLENLSTAPVVGNTVYYAFGVGFGYLLLWIPTLFLPSCSKKVLPISLILLCCLLLIKSLPTHRLAMTAKEAWDTIMFVANHKKEINEKFLRKDFQASTRNPYDLYCKDCNVIIIFAEGTSKRVISEELTPNTLRFASESIQFANYFNHQAATFRGIRGSLCSSFSLKGGFYQTNDGLGQMEEKDIYKQYKGLLESLPSILNEHGYHTHFLSPHDRNDRLAALMSTIGFQTTSIAQVSPFETDRETYERLFNQAVDLRKKNKPFLLTTYIVGTHHGLDSPDIKFGDGSNPYLNKFHNQDFWFGKFLEKFNSSDLAKNTLLIFTTDHATYPTPEYQKVFHTSCSVFHDQIPLYFYKKGIEPDTVDAHFRTSLALTPTVLDLLRITEVKNHFLANSLFSEPTQWERYAAQGMPTFHVDDDGVVRENHSPEFTEMLKDFYQISG